MCIPMKYFLIQALIFYNVAGSRVIELDESFDEIRKADPPWLVQFYTPWCGHCKRLEPVWLQVAQALYGANVHVGRIDCSRLVDVCRQYNIIGSPTVQFINKDREYTFTGDKTVEAIVEFVGRMAAPLITPLTTSESWALVKRTQRLFFLFVGNGTVAGGGGPLWEAYMYAASFMQPFTVFYSMSKALFSAHNVMMNLTETTAAIFVYKTSTDEFYPYDAIDEQHESPLNTSVLQWINEERFETFQKITVGNLNDILRSRKYLVAAIVQENKVRRLPADHELFKDMLESVIVRRPQKYRQNFQFGWIGESELGNNLVLQTLALPALIVYNTSTHHYYIPDDESYRLTADAIDLFLDCVQNGTCRSYGGNSWAIRLYRAFFQMKSGFLSLWRGNPILTAVIFGLPFGFFCMIIYSICFADILDADQEDDDDEKESLLHEKKE